MYPPFGVRMGSLFAFLDFHISLILIFDSRTLRASDKTGNYQVGCNEIQGHLDFGYSRL